MLCEEHKSDGNSYCKCWWFLQNPHYQPQSVSLSLSLFTLLLFPPPPSSHTSSAQVTCNRATWGMCENQVAIAPNFAPGGVENGWKCTISLLLGTPELLVVDIRPDGTLGAQSYPAVFDKDFDCRKSLFYPLSSPIL